MCASWKKRRSAFTLVEILTATGLSVMVLAVLVNLLILPMRAWHDTWRTWLVDSQAKMVREKLLQAVCVGKNGVGLRMASPRSPSTFASGNSINVNVDTRQYPVAKDMYNTTANNDYEQWALAWNSTTKALTATCNGVSKSMMPSSSVTVTGMSFQVPTTLYNGSSVPVKTDGTNNSLVATGSMQTSYWGKTYSRSIYIQLYLINP